MKYLSIILLLLFTSSAIAGSTQTNTSGSNTAIEGGYTSTATTTYQSGSSSNTTTNSTSNSNVKSAPPSAGAPSYNSMTQDVCAVGVSLGVQTFGLGISGGKHAIDKNCERLKLARILNDFGMKVAAVAILCQDERVFESMIQAGTPCPIDGKIGKEAKQLWYNYDNDTSKNHNYNIDFSSTDNDNYIAIGALNDISSTTGFWPGNIKHVILMKGDMYLDNTYQNLLEYLT